MLQNNEQKRNKRIHQHFALAYCSLHIPKTFKTFFLRGAGEEDNILVLLLCYKFFKSEKSRKAMQKDLSRQQHLWHILVIIMMMITITTATTYLICYWPL